MDVIKLIEIWLTGRKLYVSVNGKKLIHKDVGYWNCAGINIIVRIEFSPLGTINVNNGH